ncbi:hypothetical protein J3E68DRAFT_75016 [Trichoderma sp. SZMC 28012]
MQSSQHVWFHCSNCPTLLFTTHWRYPRVTLQPACVLSAHFSFHCCYHARFVFFLFKYNFVLSAACSCDIAISGIIILFALQYTGIQFYWWGNMASGIHQRAVEACGHTTNTCGRAIIQHIARNLSTLGDVL